MRRAMWRGEQHETLHTRCDALQRRRRRRERRDPHEKHRVDTVQACIERVGRGEIAAHHFHVVRQVGGVRVAAQGADPARGAAQLLHNLAADVPCRSRDEDALHRTE